MTYIIRFLFVVICFTGIAAVNAQTFDVSNVQLEKIIEPYVKSHMFSGAILVAEEGDVILEKAYGMADIENSIANDVETRFQLGSMTKSFTATLILQLVQQGQLDLNVPISRYLPKLATDKSSKITIHHLLGNTSGLPNYFQIEGWTEGRFNVEISDDDFIQEIEKLDLLFEPGQRYFYSNAAYFLLGQIIEKVIGKSYAEVLEEQIFSVMLMDNSGAATRNDMIEKRAEGYILSSSGGFKKQKNFNMDVFKAAGNVYSTVDNIYRWDQALYSDELLSEASRALMFDPKNRYAWDIEKIKMPRMSDELTVHTYNGQIEGYSTMITRFVDNRHTIIILSNTGMGYLSKKKLTNEIAIHLYGVSSPEKKKLVSHQLYKAIYEGNLDEAMERILAHRFLFKADEEIINELGSQLTWTDESKIAIRLFKLNASLFPESPGALFQVAETYKGMKDTVNAIIYYKQVQEVLPDNQYVKRQVEELEKE